MWHLRLLTMLLTVFVLSKANAAELDIDFSNDPATEFGVQFTGSAEWRAEGGVEDADGARFDCIGIGVRIDNELVTQTALLRIHHISGLGRRTSRASL